MKLSRQSGVALAVLLWFIAALSLLVAGIMSTAKVDVRYARINTSLAEATALTDGATLLFLNDLTRQNLPLETLPDDAENEPSAASFFIGQHEVYVRATPSSGLINLLTADSELLVDLFVVGAGLEASEAEKMAESVLQWRTLSKVDSVKTVQVSSAKAQVLEDLLSIPGMTREIYENVSLLVSASSKNTAKVVNVSVAPTEVLHILAGGDQNEFDRLQESEGRGGMLGATLIRIDARVALNADSVYQRSSWVELSALKKLKKTMVPWAIKRVYPVVAVQTVNFNELMYVSE